MTHSVQIHIHRCTRLLGIRFGQKPAKQQQICNGSLLRSVFYQHILFKQLASATSIAQQVQTVVGGDLIQPSGHAAASIKLGHTSHHPNKHFLRHFLCIFFATHKPQRATEHHRSVQRKQRTHILCRRLHHSAAESPLRAAKLSSQRREFLFLVRRSVSYLATRWRCSHATL